MRDGRGIAAFEEARTQQLVNLDGGVHGVSAHKIDAADVRCLDALVRHATTLLQSRQQSVTKKKIEAGLAVGEVRNPPDNVRSSFKQFLALLGALCG